jgi:hypothetical protein
MQLELTPQEIYDQYSALGYQSYPRAAVVERDAYVAADDGMQERAERLLYLAEQLHIKQRNFFQFSHELSEKPAGARIRKRYSGKRNVADEA